MSQPTVTVRFNNPRLENTKYTVDVEFKSDTPGHKIHACNLEFWYDSADFSRAVKLGGFANGYAPGPPTTSDGSVPFWVALPHAINWFNFAGDSIFAGKAFFQLSDKNKGVVLTDSWTKLLQVEFTVIRPIPIPANFKPPLVFDLEVIPANGGYIPNNEGLVISTFNPQGVAGGAIENAIQYNWNYTGTGKAPFGTPTK